ncbi:hypothetical protein TNCV_1445941 [Trichonephila clavipes]|nr:hypothetical protein TNCV_1445941 [Trichonephila clavipes]
MIRVLSPPYEHHSNQIHCPVMRSNLLPLKTRRVGKFVESSNVSFVYMVWKLGEKGASSGSSTSLDHGSKLRSPSPKALE